MRPVLRLVALACLVLGVAYVGLINEFIELDRQLHHSGLQRQLFSYGLSLVGFCVAAFGFGMAARHPVLGEPDMAEAADEKSVNQHAQPV